MKDVLNCTPTLKDYKLDDLERYLFLLGMWLHQGKNTFHINVTSHNAEVKLCNLYQFFGTRKAEVLNSLIINTTAKANDTTDILQTFR